MLKSIVVFYLLHTQLQCTIKDEWMWDFICKKWLNEINCHRNENNVIHLMSFVKHEHVEKPKDCLFFLKSTSKYTNKSEYISPIL